MYQGKKKYIKIGSSSGYFTNNFSNIDNDDYVVIPDEKQEYTSGSLNYYSKSVSSNTTTNIKNR